MPIQKNTEREVELEHGLVVSESSVRDLLARCSSPDGRVTVTDLSSYLALEGLDASREEVQEMVAMLGQSPAASKNAEGACAAEEINGEEESMWADFVNRCFLVGESSVRSGVLEAAALFDRDPFVYVALPSLALLDICAAPPPATIPKTWRAITAPLEVVAARLLETPTLTARLRLACAADPGEGASFESDEAITQLRGLLQGSATLLTQTATFRASFEGVLELLGAVLE